MVDMKLFLHEEDLFGKCVIFYATVSAKTVNKTFDTAVEMQVTPNQPNVKRNRLPANTTKLRHRETVVMDRTKNLKKFAQ